jgi:outer membrane protein OmpA-like peptidoglycan-associated protein
VNTRRRSWVLSIAVSLAAGSAFGVEPAAAPLSEQPGDSAFHYFPVYSSRPEGVCKSQYVPSGYMGDTNTLVMSAAPIATHDGKGSPLKVIYRPARGQKGWAGIYWQQPANNWGERAGKAGFDLSGATRLVFWARGEKGGEKIHEVAAGGIVGGRYPDSDTIKKGPIKLTTEWQRFDLDLAHKDLKHIIGGFAFFMTKYDTSGESTIYLDDIAYELPLSIPLPPTCAPKPVPPTPEPVISAPKDLDVKKDDTGLRVTFKSQVLFGTGKDVLLPGSHDPLNQVIDLIKAYPENNVLIEGHTDSTGGADLNRDLSTRRAEHVRSYLVSKGGFDGHRFKVVGYGSSRPIAPNTTREGRSKNRRVEVIILKTEEKK